MSCMSMSRLHCWRIRNHASGIDPRARAATLPRSRQDRPAAGAHAVSSSASHSAWNSRRAHAGVNRATHAMNRRSRLRMPRARCEPAEVLEPLHGRLESTRPRRGDLVIPACGTLFAPRDLLALPIRPDEAERVEAAERGIDGAGLQPRAIRDVEAVPHTVSNRVEHERRRIGDVIAAHSGTLYRLNSI